MPRSKQGKHVYVCPKCGDEVSTDVLVREVTHTCRSNHNKRTVYVRKEQQ